MHRINTTNKATDLFGAGKHGWRNGDKALGINPTEMNAEMWNAIQEELCKFVESTGGTLDPNNPGQVYAAVQAMIEARVGDYSLDTGTANAKVVALNPAITAYTGNFGGAFKNALVNTGATTIDFGAGAVPLVNAAGAALVDGDLPSGFVVGYQYIHAAAKAYITSTVPSQAMSQAQGDARYLLLANYVSQTFQMFTSSGVWTKPAGCRRIRVRVISPGGGGGGGNGNGGAGGGGGGFAEDLLNAAALTTETVTIGAVGTGGAAGGANNGTAGGTSSFGAHVVASGGAGGGGGNGAPGQGGIGTTGAILAGGSSGSGSATALGAAGGSSALGGGGAVGTAGRNYGGGGGGGSGSSAGGNGAPGIVIVEEFY